MPGGQHTGRGDGARPQPLELYERRATRAHGQRAPGGGVHVVPAADGGRRWQLHGGGHVRGAAAARGQAGVTRAGPVQPAVVHRAVRGPVEPEVLRRGLRHGTGPGAHGQRHGHGGPVRPAHHRAAGLGVRVASGRRGRAAHGVRRPVAHDHVHAAVHRRPLGQPGVRAAPAVRLGGPRVPAPVGQHGRVRLRPAGPVVRRVHVHPASVRRRRARETVHRVRQQPPHHRTHHASAVQRHSRRWYTLGQACRPSAGE